MRAAVANARDALRRCRLRRPPKKTSAAGTLYLSWDVPKRGKQTERVIAKTVYKEFRQPPKPYVSKWDWDAIQKNYGKPSDLRRSYQPAELQRIVAKVRSEEQQGTKQCQKLREAGFLPGVLYGPGVDGDMSRHLLMVDYRVVEAQMRRLQDSILATVFELELEGVQVDGKPYVQRVIMRDLDRDPGNARPISMNFLRYKPMYPVKIPICYINEDFCLPLARGGFLVRTNNFIKCTCEGELIPEMILVDLQDGYAGEVVRMSRVIWPPGVKPYNVPEDYVLGTITGKRLYDTEEEETTVAAEAEAPSTEGKEAKGKDSKKADKDDN